MFNSRISLFRDLQLVPILELYDKALQRSKSDADGMKLPVYAH